MWSSCLPALVSRDWHNFYEYTGILTLVLGVVAMVFTYRFLRRSLTKPSAATIAAAQRG